MPSWTQIANRALGWLREGRIQNYLDTADKRALEFRTIYEQVRDETLTRHTWNCAMTRAALDADTAAPAWGFARQFTLPTDPYCLRVWQLSPDAHPGVPFKVLGRKVHCDEAAPLKIEYIARVEDPMQFSPLLALTISAYIAEALALPLTGSESARDAMEAKAERYLTQARSADGQEGTPDEIAADEFLGARW